MDNLINSASKILKGTKKAFIRYPATMANAIAFSLITLIRVHLDWPRQEEYNFLLNCFHLSLGLGAILSLTLTTAAQSYLNDKKSFALANMLGILSALTSFILLYFFSGSYPQYSNMRYKVVSTIAAARVSAVIFISFLFFIVLAARPKEESDFSKSLFMVHKSFFIASIYGLVMMSGGSIVAGAIQGLLYRDLSSKIYGYIATISSFLAFTIFISYFPDFRKDSKDEQREIAQYQPRFIQVLLEYILTPIMLALTLVLILWAGKTAFSGMDVDFFRLSTIATSYAVGGIWLHILLTHYESGMPQFYKKIYSYAAIVILAFEAWALILQLRKYGLKTTEYLFIILWIITLTAALLLLFRKERAHDLIVVVSSILIIISVFPYVGYNYLPVKVQIGRLESFLIKENMLENNKIIPTSSELDSEVREIVTSTVLFLANSEDVALPSWFSRDLNKDEVFKKTLGFNQTFTSDYDGPDRDYFRSSLYLEEDAFEVEGYQWVVNIENPHIKKEFTTIEGKKGIYKIYWNQEDKDEIADLKIYLNDSLIVEDNMNDFLSGLISKYPLIETRELALPLKDMTYVIESSDIGIMIIFNEVSMELFTDSDKINYWTNPYSIFIKEKP